MRLFRRKKVHSLKVLRERNRTEDLSSGEMRKSGGKKTPETKLEASLVLPVPLS